jgi:hypothetical protein
VTVFTELNSCTILVERMPFRKSAAKNLSKNRVDPSVEEAVVKIAFDYPPLVRCELPMN